MTGPSVSDISLADTLNQQGASAYRRGDLAAALTITRRATLLHPGAAPLHFNRGLYLQAMGDSAGAACAYRHALAVQPDDPETLCNLGNALQALGRPQEAESCYREALLHKPDLARGHYNRALALRKLGDRPGAIGCYRTTLALQPAHADALTNLGNSLKRQDALSCFRRVLAIEGETSDTMFALGTALRDLGDSAGALEHFRRAVELAADNADAQNAFGLVFYGQGNFTEAIGRYRQALVLEPAFTHAYNNLGSALKAQGLLPEAVHAFGRALDCDPNAAMAHSNLLYTRLYCEDSSLTDALARARGWNARHSHPLAEPRPHAPAVTPRIGFISGDFRVHAVGYLAIAAIEQLARCGHDLTFYHNHRQEDAMTRRFRAAGSWRQIDTLTDEELAAQIAADRIDILIDLSGHSADNRLTALARKPAPVQIAGWLGYPATTGLDAVDYVLADLVQIPDAALSSYSEKVVRLPDSYTCYQPLSYVLADTCLPVMRNGYVTFGSFNENSKVTPGTVAAWARILRKAEGSKLLFKSARFTDPLIRRRYADLLASHGIASERITFAGHTSPQAHVAMMAEADIALDSFPYTGGLTTLDCLWMGVPVITQPRDTWCSRHAASYLTTVGLGELIARDSDHYVALAADLAADLPRLAGLRAGLRKRMMNSPLCDEARFVRHLESALERIWQDHLAGRPATSFDVPPQTGPA